MKKWYVLVLVSLTLALILGACGSAEKEATEEAAEAVERLQLIKDRGKVIVGCNAELPGFGEKVGRFLLMIEGVFRPVVPEGLGCLLQHSRHQVQPSGAMAL